MQITFSEHSERKQKNCVSIGLCLFTVEQTSSATCDLLVSTNPPRGENFAASENWFRFSDRHGEQVTVSRDLRSAVRINPLTEFNNAVVMSHRPLRDDELFEIIVEKVVHRWSGSLEAGACTLVVEWLKNILSSASTSR